ncbi:MAG: tRNA lysidine(34) synthetase TilS [Candidatus Theseobacter exili]|nr:tRNA lysidine(34) synthetase TilS [Candidatus Theseobacter exili]
MIKDIILNSIKRYSMLDKGSPVLLSVSGGPDSIAMMYLLKEISQALDLKLVVAHLNHQLRGQEADGDALFVVEQGKQLGIKVITDETDVKKLAEKNRLSIEEAGRKARYLFLEKTAIKENIKIIATGHTRDDLAETIIMRLLRGCGTIGLLGIPPVRSQNKLTIIRPLIELTRKDIMNYLDNHKIPYRVDTSNLDNRFLRNRIRNDLLPFLENDFNPKAREVLINLSKILDSETDFFEQTLQPIYKQMVEKRQRHYTLNISEFKAIHEALQRSILRRMIMDTKGNLLGITYNHIEDLMDLIFLKPSGRQIHLPDDITAVKEYNLILLSRGEYSKPVVEGGPVEIPGTTKFDIPRMEVITEILTTETIEISKLAKHAGKLSRTWNDPNHNGISEFEEFFDADRIGEIIFFRSRSKGDRFTPIGFEGSKKIKDILIDEKISPRFRETIPILTTANEIAWIVGYRISEYFKILETSKRVLRIKVRFFH